jgi:spore maturation protein SpmA/spore maturation protein SpmB
MILNYIWIGFFLIGFLVALIHFFNEWAIWGDYLAGSDVFDKMVKGIFTMAETGFELSLGLAGILTFWCGLMKVGESGGAINIISRWVSPLFTRLFPQIPKGHPAQGAIMMNFSANMLGLDNAATPLGLKAMDHLQDLNTEKNKATNSMIMFLVLNTSGLTIIPFTIMSFRAQHFAANAEHYGNNPALMNPTDIFLPILFATFISSLAGLMIVSAFQRINLFQPVILLYIGITTLIVSSLAYYVNGLDANEASRFSIFLSSFIILIFIVFFIGLALKNKVNVYDNFIEGAKEGFLTAIKIVPFLIAMLVGIAVFRDSGAMAYLVDGIGWIIALFVDAPDVAEALPTAFMRPFSGGGARALMIESWGTADANSITGRMTSVIQGCTETTFYTLAVYYGAIGVTRTRYTVTCGLFADLCGIIAAIILTYVFFG